MDKEQGKFTARHHVPLALTQFTFKLQFPRKRPAFWQACSAQNLCLHTRHVFPGMLLGGELVGLLRQSRRHLVQVSGKRSQRRQRGRKRRKGAPFRRHGHAHASAQHTNQPAWGQPHSHGERSGVGRVRAK